MNFTLLNKLLESPEFSFRSDDQDRTQPQFPSRSNASSQAPSGEFGNDDIEGLDGDTELPDPDDEFGVGDEDDEVVAFTPSAFRAFVSWIQNTDHDNVDAVLDALEQFDDVLNDENLENILNDEQGEFGADDDLGGDFDALGGEDNLGDDLGDDDLGGSDDDLRGTGERGGFDDRFRGGDASFGKPEGRDSRFVRRM